MLSLWPLSFNFCNLPLIILSGTSKVGYELNHEYGHGATGTGTSEYNRTVS